ASSGEFARCRSRGRIRAQRRNVQPRHYPPLAPLGTASDASAPANFLFAGSRERRARGKWTDTIVASKLVAAAQSRGPAAAASVSAEWEGLGDARPRRPRLAITWRRAAGRLFPAPDRQSACRLRTEFRKKYSARVSRWGAMEAGDREGGR